MPGGTRALRLSESLAGLAGTPILLASDFDGTLAGIVDNPSDARPDPRALAALIELARAPRVSVAVISGRGRDDLEHLIGDVPGIVLIGEHGNDSGSDQGGASDLIDEVSAQLEEIAADYPGAGVERKRFSVVFHYRSAGEGIEQGLTRVRSGPGQTPGVTMSEGKKVLELHTTTLGKGDAVEQLRKSTGAAAVVFLGDDVTDESVFVRLQPNDVGIKVGDGASAAEYRIADVSEVADVLEEISFLFH